MSARVRVERIGREASPVLVVDDLLTDPEPLVRDAYAAAYGPPAVPSFPGVRARTPADYPALLRRALLPLLQDVFGLAGCDVLGGSSDFSLVTRPASALAVRQRIPHTDTPNPNMIALLHYLTAGGCSGTSFYRHRATGFENVTPERRSAYETRLAAEMRQGEPVGYIGGDTDHFERTGGFDGVFNRLIAYRGTLLHSGDVARDFAFSDDPRQGRLTANTFFVLASPAAPGAA